MKTKQGIMSEARKLFSLAEILIYIAIVFVIHVFFFWYITSNYTFTGIIAVAGTIYFLLVFIVPNRRLKRYQDNLNEILKYVTNASYLLKSGQNVIYALEGTLVTVSKEIAKDIKKTIDKLETEAVLDTEHFKKYEFPALNQFHQGLQIQYEKGGNDPSKIFDRIQNDMVFELKKRDELYRKRKGYAFNLYFLTAISFSMMPIMKSRVEEQWTAFVQLYPVAGLTSLTVVYLIHLTNLYVLQKHSLDISVRF